MRQGDLPYTKHVLIAISRHMCYQCKKIVAHLARNGKRKLVIATPRRGRRIPFKNVQQPEFVFYKEDGSYEVFERQSASKEAPFGCTKFSFANPPQSLDVYMPPSTSAVRNQITPFSDAALRNFRITGACPEAENTHGPGNRCFHFIRDTLPVPVECPLSGTLTGIHGTFGSVGGFLPYVMSSIGIYCDVTVHVAARGIMPGLKIPFDLKCPEHYQMTGIYGNMGDFVDKIGIICTRIFDGHIWRSALAGTSDGGNPVERSCEPRAAGNKLKLWPGDKVIDGLGMCCR